MIETGAFDDIAHIIEPDMFYKDSHQRIFRAIEQLSAEKKPIDIMTVSQQLRDAGDLEMAGGPYAITMLTGRIASASNIVFHSFIIYEKYILRKIISMSGELMQLAYEDDFMETKASYANNSSIIDDLLAGKRSDKTLAQIMKDHMADLDERTRKAKQGIMVGVPTGLRALDYKTNGFQPGDLIIVAGRPSMGKTAVALKLAKSASEAKCHILFFSLEMTNIPLASRLTCSYGGISPDNLSKGTLTPAEWDKYHETSSELQKLPFSIDDNPRADLIHISAVSRSKRRKGLCDMIVIDYLQLIDSPNTGKTNGFNNREQEISKMSRGLKLLAKELDVPVILLAQLSRAVEQRGGDKRPILSDLRESGAIEQDADMVIFPYRPEYYKITQDSEGNSTEGLMILGIAKYRNGSIGDVYAKCSPDLTQITDYIQHPF